MNINNRRIIVVILVALVVMFATGYAFYRWMHRPLPLSEETQVRIQPGMSGRAIGRLLKENEVIESVELFRWILWVYGVERDLRLGTMVLEPPLSRHNLVEKLSQKNPDLARVRLKEGWPSWRIFEELSIALDIDKNQFEKLYDDPDFLSSAQIPAETLEGYLYPETYYISLDAAPRAVLLQLIDKFNSITRQLNLQQRAEKVGLELHEAVTLASIIEREARVADEYRRVSAVYHNRLRRGMKLQADPTVLFVLEDFNRPITRSNLNIISPYNTYQTRGLPPGPIASPSRRSLAAAVNPADTDDLYFVSRGDGSHVFSENYEQHREAVNKYQR